MKPVIPANTFSICHATERVIFSILILVFGYCCVSPRLWSQAAAASPANLEKARKNFSERDPSSVVLTGYASLYAGQNAERGEITLSTDAKGAYKLTFKPPQGELSESGTPMGSARSCQWIKAGITHVIQSSNCWLSIAWFFPHLFFTTAYGGKLSTSGTGIDAQNRSHFQVSTSPNAVRASSKAMTGITKWSRADVVLDPITQLPVELNYTQYLASTTENGIKDRVLFSDYTEMQGVKIPRHIQKYVNGTLQWDIDISSSSIEF